MLKSISRVRIGRDGERVAGYIEIMVITTSAIDDDLRCAYASNKELTQKGKAQWGA